MEGARKMPAIAKLGFNGAQGPSYAKGHALA